MDCVGRILSRSRSQRSLSEPRQRPHEPPKPLLSGYATHRHRRALLFTQRSSVHSAEPTPEPTPEPSSGSEDDDAVYCSLPPRISAMTAYRLAAAKRGVPSARSVSSRAPTLPAQSFHPGNLSFRGMAQHLRDSGLTSPDLFTARVRCSFPTMPRSYSQRAHTTLHLAGTREAFAPSSSTCQEPDTLLALHYDRTSGTFQQSPSRTASALATAHRRRLWERSKGGHCLLQASSSSRRATALTSAKL